jgi:uncharacterized protein YcbX
MGCVISTPVGGRSGRGISDEGERDGRGVGHGHEAETNGRVGTVAEIRRYPVKSLLGETLPVADVVAGGIAGDRALALIDAATGRVATAKHPRLWRSLLQFSAATEPAGVVIALPDGTTVGAGDARSTPCSRRRSGATSASPRSGPRER